jgi:hypothetical protein
MRCARIFCSLILVFAFAGCSKSKRNETPRPTAQAVATPSAQTGPVATGDQGAVVRTSMQNVDYHLTDRVIVNIASLTGRLTPKPGKIPVFDDKNSFGLDVDTASITLTTTALTNDLNDWVFVKPDAPLKDLKARIKGDQLVVKGLLVSRGGIPFESTGTMSVTPEGMIRVHTTKVTALHLPVKGLMDLVGLDTEKLIETKKVEGVSLDKDDLIIDPEHVLSPPQLRGHLTGLKVENGAIGLTFGPENGRTASAPLPDSCGARNYLHFAGGSVRFGKLTMKDTDLELMDSTSADPFDFAIDHYNEQLVAGYSKMTQSGGLCVHMPDYNKLNQPENPKK